MSVPIALLGEVVLAGAVVAGCAMLLVGRAGTDADVPVDAGDDGLPDGTVHADDLPRLRFGLAARGYRMAEVDAFVDRMAGELSRRDALIHELGGDVADLADPPAAAAPFAQTSGFGVPPAPASVPTPSPSVPPPVAAEPAPDAEA